MSALSTPELTSPPTATSRQQLGATSLVLGAALLAVTLAVNPGPSVAHVAAPGWVPGHLLTAAAYLLLLLGLPAVSRYGRGWTGALGVAGLMVHFAVSTGSQLYYARIVPVLAALPGVSGSGRLGPDGPLASLYGGWRDAFTVVAAVASLALAHACWRAAPRQRFVAALLGVAAVGELFVTPLALLAFVAVFGSLGIRLLRTTNP